MSGWRTKLRFGLDFPLKWGKARRHVKTADRNLIENIDWASGCATVTLGVGISTRSQRIQDVDFDPFYIFRIANQTHFLSDQVQPVAAGQHPLAPPGRATAACGARPFLARPLSPLPGWLNTRDWPIRDRGEPLGFDCPSTVRRVCLAREKFGWQPAIRAKSIDANANWEYPTASYF